MYPCSHGYRLCYPNRQGHPYNHAHIGIGYATLTARAPIYPCSHRYRLCCPNRQEHPCTHAHIGIFGIGCATLTAKGTYVPMLKSVSAVLPQPSGAPYYPCSHRYRLCYPKRQGHPCTHSHIGIGCATLTATGTPVPMLNSVSAVLP